MPFEQKDVELNGAVALLLGVPVQQSENLQGTERFSELVKEWRLDRVGRTPEQMVALYYKADAALPGRQSDYELNALVSLQIDAAPGAQLN